MYHNVLSGPVQQQATAMMNCLVMQLHVEAVTEAPKELVLDTRDLTLHEVSLQPSGEKLKYKLGDRHKVSSSMAAAHSH